MIHKLVLSLITLPNSNIKSPQTLQTLTQNLWCCSQAAEPAVKVAVMLLNSTNKSPQILQTLTQSLCPVVVLAGGGASREGSGAARGSAGGDKPAAFGSGVQLIDSSEITLKKQIGSGAYGRVSAFGRPVACS